MIITLTANPAIDLNFATDRLAFDHRSYLLARSEAPGGRGINASCVLHALGASTLAIAPTGGGTGERFERLVRAFGFDVELIPIKEGIRVNRSITDRHGLTVKLDERGPVLGDEEVKRLAGAVVNRLADAEWLLLCGSLPPGVPKKFYRDLIERAREKGVKTLLDSDEHPLQDGLEGRPTVVAPNLAEAGRLLNRALLIKAHFHEAVKEIQRMGAENVILSLGSRGVVAVYGDTLIEVVPPRVDAVCPIGAGDALNAAFVWAISRGHDFVDAVRWGVAAGTASAVLPGLEFANLDRIRKVLANVEARPVA